mmetsp:Transcript_37732/g.82697  ORF Transcript_37732/g.82697 Transcript_37732/m.82697 type:complete len:460 (+) Transcript_37732:192-1571(+)|eukprot:CAMPEP_0178525480 /NCGR_PEP_ID=MMETSP0696-20121128/30204_1 /TAXON_ID=265572 /ORGANISM="Extubocellulus spinifer, Strain CCMP396" /LENGTH=459 /DNA_ID=CAMNT_0020156895 /DNA_START=191 /DNA_END=1570 /DNA_ORIENTATION=-
MPQCHLSPNGTHRYVPSPATLSSVTCLHCNHTKLCTKAKCASKYLKYRRACQHSQGLRNISVRLDDVSAQSLADVLAKAGIKSKTDGPRDGNGSGGGKVASTYVTLMEGLLPETNTHQLEQEAPCVADVQSLQMKIDTLRSSLDEFSTITVRKLHKIRRSDRTSDLLLADVSLHPDVSAHLVTLASSKDCVLPQYPCYIALGTVSREGRVSVNALKSIRKLLQGHDLALDGASLQCKPLSSSSSRGINGGKRRSFASATDGYSGSNNFITMASQQQHSSNHPSEQLSRLSADSAPYKLRHQPDFVRSASNKSTSTAETDTEQTAYLSESSTSDHETSGELSIPSPTRSGTDVTLVTDSPTRSSRPFYASGLSRPMIITRHSSAPVFLPSSPTGLYGGKNPSMDEADVICDLTFLDSNTPPSSPCRPSELGVEVTTSGIADAFCGNIEQRPSATAFSMTF